VTASAQPQTRRFRRRTLRVRVELDLNGATREEWATTLGAGGLFLETAEPIRVGTRLRLRFRLPGGRTLHELDGRVVWAMAARPGAGSPAPSPGIGVEFTDVAATAALAHELERAPEPQSDAH
jgi:uncharacterized protein (TIGR02266 family)